MKRSNLFLTLTTGCLALASFAFAKAHRAGTFTTAWCSVNIANQCTAFTQQDRYTLVQQTNKAHCNINHHLYTAHTLITATGKCGRLLYTIND